MIVYIDFNVDPPYTVWLFIYVFYQVTFSMTLIKVNDDKEILCGWKKHHTWFYFFLCLRFYLDYLTWFLYFFYSFSQLNSEVGLQWKSSGRGICGNRVLQRSQQCGQTPPYGIQSNPSVSQVHVDTLYSFLFLWIWFQNIGPILHSMPTKYQPGNHN